MILFSCAQRRKCVDPKWLIVKVVVQNGSNDRPEAVIGRIGHASHLLGSLLGAIELTISCAFVCRVGYSNAQIRVPLIYKQ